MAKKNAIQIAKVKYKKIEGKIFIGYSPTNLRTFAPATQTKKPHPNFTRRWMRSKPTQGAS